MSEEQIEIILLRCSCCKEMKTLDCFHADNRPKAIKNRYGKKYWCISCYKNLSEQPHVRLKQLANYKRCRTKLKINDPIEYSRRNRVGALKKRGIVHDEFDVLLKSQGDVCAICKTSEPGGKYNQFIVDHCHITNVIRGILCNSCNAALGNFKDDVDILNNVIKYINHYSNR